MRYWLLAVTMVVAGTMSASANEPALSPEKVKRALKAATRFMVENVATEGGYVWLYEKDMSRRWGELEATRSMVWVQAPGTPGMGHTFLDAYAVTGDGYYLEAAKGVADVLVRGQHPSGGWDYFFDLEGPGGAEHWYETIGRNAWRAEEFHHYRGNATFDDGGTIDAATLLLRFFLLTGDQSYHKPMARALDFVLNSQYPMGGWPQRYPLGGEGGDYTGSITLNDDVAQRNIGFLLLCHLLLDDTDLLEPLYRAMFAFLPLQLGPEQPGWALQYDQFLRPVAARSYEPPVLSPSTTFQVIQMLLDFHRLTGESRFLARIPAALEWMASLQLPSSQVVDNRDYPRLVELGTNRPLYLYRRGSNAINGQYYVSHDPPGSVIHYRSTGRMPLGELESAYEAALARSTPALFQNLPEAEALRADFIATGNVSFPGIGNYTGGGGDICFGRDYRPTTPSEILDALETGGYWTRTSSVTSNSYLGEGPAEVAAGDYSTTWVGDRSDTSPHCNGAQREVISAATYMHHMKVLMDWLRRENRGG